MKECSTNQNAQKAPIANLTKDEVLSAVQISTSFTQLVQNLGFSDGDQQRLKIKKKLEELTIDTSHFSSKRPPVPDHIKKARRHETNKRSAARLAEQRKNPELRAKFILEDAKRKDKKEGFTGFDLTIEIIDALIKLPCKYCGETELMMTLDRMNNTIGHIYSNVNQSCIRCNMIRRDMPYDAWLFLVPGVRKAREEGKFSAWTGAIHK